MKDKAIATAKINNREYSIRATAHALERMEQRNIDEEIVTGNILLLGKQRIAELQEAGEEIIIIDKDRQVSLVIGFNKNKIMVITVIDKSNIWVKEGTKIERLN